MELLLLREVLTIFFNSFNCEIYYFLSDFSTSEVAVSWIDDIDFVFFIALGEQGHLAIASSEVEDNEILIRVVEKTVESCDACDRCRNHLYLFESG